MFKIRLTTLLLLCSLFYITSCKKEVKQKEVVQYKVTTNKITTETIQSTIELLGDIKSEGRHDLSFLVDGKLIAVKVKEGQTVKKGTVIAKLDQADYREAVKIAKAKLEEANDQLGRLQKMYDAGSLAEADYKKIVYLQQQAESNYKIYRNKLKYTTLVSSISGKVAKVWVKSGGGISQGEPVVSIIDNNTVYASVGVPENKINKIDLTKEAKIIVEATSDTLYGAVSKVYPTASKMTRTFQLDVLIDNKKDLFKDGMLCTVVINVNSSENIIKVPLDHIINDIDGMKYVFIKRNDIARKQRVYLGDIVGNDIIIVKGLFNNDELIINPPLKLMDGNKVI
ncbi:efflux RND transporter periplasmic adaptor subunit [Flammeovirga pectinis]|uniref:Efflux RND transporter periplasmic adaptor subunit n=1 Tax=Flammeovirga pectinis TaxID=2494373 RepID=A0A3S9PAQ4_9BACT|nr:efflux RND transporter periplasmic adaptor subunit [Flammeovirga pectinis]